MNILVCGLFSAAESYGKTTAVVEIIVMLLVAFLLGYLFRHFLGHAKLNRRWEEKYNELLQQYELAENRLKTFESENKKLLRESEDYRNRWLACQKELEALKARLDACLKSLDEWQQKAESYRAKRDHVPPEAGRTQPEVPPDDKGPALTVAGMPQAESGAARTEPKDDLKKIEGIGPKIERMLNEAGIRTFEQLADTPVEILRQILEKGGPAYKVHNPESWPYQARLAARGRWEELRKWQDEHKWGRF